MKISFIIPGIFESGGIKIIYEYANRLSSRGHMVSVYSPAISYNFYKSEFRLVYLAKKMMRDYVLPNNKPEMLKNKRFFLSEVARITDSHVSDADVVIATAWPTAYSVYKLNAKKGIKVYLVQGYEIWNSNVKSVDESYKLPLNRITVSDSLRNLLLDKFNSKSTVIHNGIDFSRFDCSHKINRKYPVLSFVSNDNPGKNFDAVVRTIEKIHNYNEDIKIISFGHIERNKLPEYVEFHRSPSEEKIIEIYSETDVFLYGSLSEGFGLPPAEAMACKCAVVTNNVGAIPDYSKHLFSAYNCDPNNPCELFQGVKYFLENKNELIRISENGYHEVRKHLNWDKSVNEFEDYLSNLLHL